MDLSSRIRELRTSKKLSQGKLAQALGVSRQAVSKWENGTTVPDMENLIGLSELFDVELSSLAGGIGKPDSPPSPAPQSEPHTPIVVNLVEKTDRIIERVVEKPVIRKVIRIKYLRNPIEFALIGFTGFLLGFLFGKMV